MKKFFVVPALILTFSTATFAQDKPIDEMFKVMSMEKQVEGGFEAMLPTIDQMAAQFNLNNESKEELKNTFREWFHKDLDHSKMMSELKRLYSQTFTNEEIAKITKFYQTPVGKKFLEQSPQLMKLGAQIGMQEAQSKQFKLMERVNAFMEKHGIKQ